MKRPCMVTVSEAIMKKSIVVLAGFLLVSALCSCSSAAQESPAATSTPEPSPVSEEAVSSEMASRAPSATASAAGSTASEDIEGSPVEETPAPDTSAFSAEEREKWEYQAYTLTLQIVDSCMQPFDEAAGLDALSTQEILNFICTTSQFDKDPDYPYKGASTITFANDSCPYILAHVPAQTARNIAYQLFGVSDWSYEDPDFYDSSVPEYFFNIEKEMPTSSYISQDATAQLSGNEVHVSFHLSGTQTVVDTTGKHLQDFGMYQANYTIQSENGQTFLRFAGMYPVQ